MSSHNKFLLEVTVEFEGNLVDFHALYCVFNWDRVRPFPAFLCKKRIHEFGFIHLSALVR